MIFLFSRKWNMTLSSLVSSILKVRCSLKPPPMVLCRRGIPSPPHTPSPSPPDPTRWLCAHGNSPPSVRWEHLPCVVTFIFWACLGRMRRAEGAEHGELIATMPIFGHFSHHFDIMEKNPSVSQAISPLSCPIHLSQSEFQQWRNIFHLINIQREVPSNIKFQDAFIFAFYCHSINSSYYLLWD